jgi:hypothetical protein
MLHSVILDDFLPDFASWRAWADGCKFTDESNPADGVTYPAICTAVPTYGTIRRLSAVMGRPIEITASFLRLSLGGAKAPHFAHHDGVMGDFSCMLYLNRPEHCAGGTALLDHVAGKIDEETWARDTNVPEKWRVKSLCEMVPNRAFIFRSTLWHAALPAGGFGSDARDGRLVWTTFYS